MENGTLTYGHLTAKLQGLGYTRHRREIDGKPMQVFDHPDRDRALILLPDAPPDRVVEPPYMHKVLIILKTHGLIEEQNPLLA
jgi:hypothetical protein